MRTSILATARDLAEKNGACRITLDEIAAAASIKLDHVRAYFTSVHAVLAAARLRPEDSSASVVC